MALYVYQGFWDDLLVKGGSRVWPSGTSAGNFLVFLLEDHVDLDTNQGLDAETLTTWAALDAQSAITEISINNYSRFSLPASARLSNWDSLSSPPELELQYNNATNPITWSNLGQGSPATNIGAYLICHDRGASEYSLWMADSSATGLPATTNGEDFTLTLNTEAVIKGYHPPQP